jgi:hypothetical protein
MKVNRANKEASLDSISWLCSGANKNTDVKVKRANQEASLDIISGFVGSQ